MVWGPDFDLKVVGWRNALKFSLFLSDEIKLHVIHHLSLMLEEVNNSAARFFWKFVVSFIVSLKDEYCTIISTTTCSLYLLFWLSKYWIMYLLYQGWSWKWVRIPSWDIHITQKSHCIWYSGMGYRYRQYGHNSFLIMQHFVTIYLFCYNKTPLGISLTCILLTRLSSCTVMLNPPCVNDMVK